MNRCFLKSIVVKFAIQAQNGGELISEERNAETDLFGKHGFFASSGNKSS
jgi:hypothetical protein